MKYRDPHTDLDSGRKIAWVTKQAGVFSPLTSSMGNAAHMRLATPRPTGKIPGMGGQAKNPFNSMQKVKAPKEPSMPSMKTAGYSHDYYMKNRQKIKLRNKRYRMANRAKLKMARKRYQRELKAGSRRKATRIRSGTQYLSYGGF